jgi:two-component system, chemotaxis family, chemotaxis protein CheY
MKSLIVEDDFTSRLLLQTILARYGQAHIAVNGREAVDAFRVALEEGSPYDLVCMDIMMPEMDGQEALRQVRALEAEQGILSSSGTKIVMTTALGEPRDVFAAFYSLCDDYLVKPIDAARLLEILRGFALIA